MPTLHLRAWRQHRAYSIRELARLAGVTTRTIVTWEGPTPPRNPHPATVRKLAGALGIEPHRLYRQPNEENGR